MGNVDRISDPRSAAVPMQNIGPLLITGPVMEDRVPAPLATFETPLFPSVQRGAMVTARSGGIQVVITDERMTRSLLFEAVDAASAHLHTERIRAIEHQLAAEVEETSRFARLIDIHPHQVANLIYLRLEFTTGDAAGHNMSTIGAQRIAEVLVNEFPELEFKSVSGNFCTDKKSSAVNGLFGRGKSVIAEARISRKLCRRYLKTTPERVVELNVQKNLLGTSVAGGLRTANAHYANMLLAFYLATGQDAANIVEGSQGFTVASVAADELYFSTTIPNVIVGAIGSGKDLPFVQDNLNMMGCLCDREPGANARRLAAICGAVVLCGELSLMAALTNPGELVKAHETYERKNSDNA